MFIFVVGIIDRGKLGNILRDCVKPDLPCVHAQTSMARESLPIYHLFSNNISVELLRRIVDFDILHSVLFRLI